MVTNGGQPKLLDFGIASLTELEEDELRGSRRGIFLIIIGNDVLNHIQGQTHHRRDLFVRDPMSVHADRVLQSPSSLENG